MKSLTAVSAGMCVLMLGACDTVVYTSDDSFYDRLSKPGVTDEQASVDVSDCGGTYSPGAGIRFPDDQVAEFRTCMSEKGYSWGS